MLRVVIACGGTGGHLFPGIAVAEELQRRGHEVLLLISQKAIDRTALTGRSDLKSMVVPGIGWPGLFSLRVIPFFFQLRKAQQRLKALFKEFRPEAVLGMGGFTSAMPLWVARHLGIGTLLHESNAIPGRVTRLCAGHVDALLVGFEACAKRLLPARSIVTGTPVRGALRTVPRTEAIAKLGLDPARKTVLIAGGSQGAQGINRIVCETLGRWETKQDAWQFIHLTGEANQAEVAEAYRRHHLHAVVQAFSQDMPEMYSAADLVISRSGASSLTELSHYHLASILIPFPAAADDHQTANAQVYEAAGGALMIPQNELNPMLFDKTVQSLLEQKERLEAMRIAARGLAVPDAAARVANEVEASAHVAKNGGPI